MYLSLPLPAHASRASLQQCIRAFTATELVAGADCWLCPRCQVRREATKTMQLWRLPPILLVQLKRFSMNGPFWDKLQTLVDFPVRGLDLAGVVDGPFHGRPYNLYGICNHYGSLSGGHYVAMCKNVMSNTCVHGGMGQGGGWSANACRLGRWFKFDDSVVTPLSEPELCTSAAYMLCYTSVDFKQSLPSFE